MQRATTADSVPTPSISPGRIDDSPLNVDCPVCGEPIRGIAASKPGEHRFVGCGHYASARFFRPRIDAGGPVDTRTRLGP